MTFLIERKKKERKITKDEDVAEQKSTDDITKTMQKEEAGAPLRYCDSRGEHEGIEYEIDASKGSTTVIKLTLKRGQTVRAVPSSMIAMSDNVTVSGKLNKSIKSILMTGDSRFQEFTVDTKTEQDGWVILAPSFFGDVQAIHLDADDAEVCLADNCFVASIGNVALSANSHGLKNSLVNGMFLKRATGRGVVFVAAVGSFLSFNLDEYSRGVVVNNDNLVAWPARNVTYECVKAGKSWFSTAVSGEGFVAKLSGTGCVLVRTRNSEHVASWIYAAKAPPNPPIPTLPV